MTRIEWTIQAFAALEILPQSVAFGIIRQVDLLQSFPEMGVPLRSRFKSLRKYRQLIYRRRYRIVYDFDSAGEVVYIMAVQSCRQKLPPARDLKRDIPTE